MQPKSKILVFIIIVLVVSNLVMLYFFLGKRETKKPHEQRKPFMVEALQKEVGFSEEQVKNMENLHGQHKEKMKKLFDSLKVAKLALYQTIGAAPGDSLRERAASAVGERQKAVDLQMVQHFTEIRGLATPAQLPAYDTMVSKFTRKMIGGTFFKNRQKADSAKEKSSK